MCNIPEMTDISQPAGAGFSGQSETLKSLLTLCKEDAMGSVNLYDESECCTIYLFEKNMCAHVRTALSYERSQA